ncbi:MAG: hypothetical protein KDJ31_10330, partial [Candidatus Competibacteraceae bacterium]|nr:hypothetical protein [Candidatus Competibacteraceae bacterium]
MSVAESAGQNDSILWRLRPDLQFESTATAGRYQVRNPVSGERFELGEEEVFLCQALSRTADPKVIQVDFAQRFDLAITADQLHQFYQDMATLGLLEPMSPAMEDITPAAADDGKQEHESYRWVFFNPNRAFAWLARHIGWLRYVTWLLAPGIPLALLVILYNQPQYQRALEIFADPGSHLLFKFTLGLFISNLFTRIAQGVAVAYVGGLVEQFGLRLEFGVVPHFFVGKSIRAATRPPQQRLAAARAAMLSKLTLFVSGILIWRLTYQSGVTLSSYAFLLGHLGLGAFLFIANPLWWGDGYVWLAVHLGLPRLRDRAFQVLGLYLRGRRPPAGLAPLEKYALVGYIVASVSYVLLLLCVVMLAKAVYLESQYQGIGVVLFLILVAMVMRWWLYRRTQKRQRIEARAQARVEAQTTLRAVNSDQSVGRQPARSKASLAAMKPIEDDPQRHYRLWLIVLALLAGASFLPYSYDVTGEVTLFPTARAEIHAVTSGIVTQVQVRENEWVTPEQALAELSAWQQDQDLAVTAAAIKRQQAELGLLQHGPKAEAIEYARQQLAAAQVRARHSRKVRELLEPVHQQGVVKALEYEEAVKTAEVDQAAVTVAEANLSLIKSPPLPLEVAAKEAELEQLRAQQTYLEEQRKRTYLRTPVAGRVVTPRPEFMTGNYLKEGDLFVAVEDHRVMRAEILAPETDIGEVRADAPVQ